MTSGKYTDIIILVRIFEVILKVFLKEDINMTTVTKEMTIGEIIMIDQGVIAVLLNYGMHCIGCPSAQGESLEEACMVHGLEVDPLVDEINAYLSSK